MLLAPSGFLGRLEQPALRFLKARIATQIRFGEVGDDEAIALLHRQLLSHRDRRIEARGFAAASPSAYLSVPLQLSPPGSARLFSIRQ